MWDKEREDRERKKGTLVAITPNTKHVLILVLVVGAFVVACMEMVAGLAVVSMGVSLGFLATLGSAFLW